MNKNTFDWVSFLIIQDSPLKYVIFMGGLKVVNNQKLFELFIYNVGTKELELCDKNKHNVEPIYKDIKQLVIENYEKRDIIKEMIDNQLKNKKSSNPNELTKIVPEVNCSIEGLEDDDSNPIFLNDDNVTNLQEYSGDELEHYINRIMSIYFDQPKIKNNVVEHTSEIDHESYLC